MSNVCNNVFLGRYKFYNARKRNTQSYIDWALYILGLSKECRFKTNLNATLRDRFITGLPEGPILNRLLQGDVYKLKFIGAIEIASECDMEFNKRKNANEQERKLQKYQTNDNLDGRSEIVSATSTEISDMIENQLPVHQRTVIKERKPKLQHITLTGKEDINSNKKGYKSCVSTAAESKLMENYQRNMDQKRSENDYNRRNDFDGRSSSRQGRPISPNKKDSNSPNHNKDMKRRKIDYNSPNTSRQSSPCRSRNRWHDSQNRSNSRYQNFDYNLTSTNLTSGSNSHKDENVSKFKQIEVKVEEIEGDLFKMPVQYSLGHCVAEDMKMGKGIGVGFRKTFNRVDELLEQREEKGGLAVLNDKGCFIYYLVTKTVNGKPTYGTMWNSLQRMKEHIVRNNVKNLALPRLGCGLDRLEWNVVKEMLEDTFSTIDIKIIICNFQK